MTDWLSGLETSNSPADLDSEFVRPPRSLAAASFVAGVVSLLVPVVTRGHTDFIGWALGLAAVLLGVAYRWRLRLRQLEPLYVPNFQVNRMMLLGVFLGFFGVIVNAYYIAQRVIT
jgi:hypothetical protein